jgi:membrane associated rhomboid family serine protease
MSSKYERNILIRSAVYPFILLSIMWLIKLIEVLFDLRFVGAGLQARNFYTLSGIITMPFIHSDWNHLVSNSTPFLFLGSMLFYFYRELSWKILLLIWGLTGVWLFIGGRDSYHIGASGIVYGLAAFLFFSGVFKNNRRLLTLTLVIAFLYGSMIWGFFPDFFPDKNISWEGHLFGFVSGLLLAFFYRKQGPEEEVWEWDDSDVPDDEDAYWRSEKKT